jgi:hypothetical protein
MSAIYELLYISVLPENVYTFKENLNVIAGVESGSKEKTVRGIGPKISSTSIHASAEIDSLE